jgi:hypothetical protein
VYVSHFFNGANAGGDVYGINLGPSETSGAAATGNVAYAFGTTYWQMGTVLAAANAANCQGTHFDTNPADYHLQWLESGIENWAAVGNGPPDNAYQNEQGMFAYTGY